MTPLTSSHGKSSLQTSEPQLRELNITHTCVMLPCNNKAMHNEFVGFARLQHPALPLEARALLVPPVLLER